MCSWSFLGVKFNKKLFLLIFLSLIYHLPKVTSLVDRGLVIDAMRRYNISDVSERTDVEMVMDSFNIIL
jgi:hypothetical protein